MWFSTMRTWTRLPVVEFHTFSVRLLAAVITVLSWRSHATMVTFSFVTLSSKGGGLYFLEANENKYKMLKKKKYLAYIFNYTSVIIFTCGCEHSICRINRDFKHTLVIWSACPAECSSIPEAAAARFELYHLCCHWQTYNKITHTTCKDTF